MIEITRQVVGMAKKIDGFADVVDVLTWARDFEGLYCTVCARVDGSFFMEVGGEEIQSIPVELGQWVVFDGDHFSALTQEEFEAKGYSDPSP
jgi:hypothetical protein